jgi:hypothetical protein
MTRTPASAPFSKDRKSITRQEVVQLWRDIERHRAALAYCSASFEDWLQLCPDLREEWERFTANGGITAAELEAHLAGKVFRHRRVRRRGRFRLIVNRRRQYRRQSDFGGDDAA